LDNATAFLFIVLCVIGSIGSFMVICKFIKFVWVTLFVNADRDPGTSEQGLTSDSESNGSLEEDSDDSGYEREED